MTHVKMKTTLEERIKALEEEKRMLLEEIEELKEVVELSEKAKDLENEVNKLKEEVKTLKDKIPQEFLQEISEIGPSLLEKEKKSEGECQKCEEEEFL